MKNKEISDFAGLPVRDQRVVWEPAKLGRVFQALMCHQRKWHVLTLTSVDRKQRQVVNSLKEAVKVFTRVCRDGEIDIRTASVEGQEETNTVS